MATTGRGIPLIDGNTVVNPIQTPFNLMANAVDAAIGDALGDVFNFKGPSNTRPATATEGDTWYETDTRRSWLYTGGTWVTREGGLYLVQPSSVSGGVITGSGGTSVSASTGVALNGIFSGRFRRYRLMFDLYAATGNLTSFGFQMRSAGANASANNYEWQIMRASGTTVDALSGTTGQGPFTSSVNGRFQGSLEISAPFDGIDTSINLDMMARTWTGVISTYRNSYLHTLSASYDGISFISTGGSFGGDIKVYGYA
jgi:hypothetical protein